jgi:hypothetical protein
LARWQAPSQAPRQAPLRTTKDGVADAIDGIAIDNVDREILRLDQGRLGRHLPCPGLGRRAARRGTDRFLGGEGASLRLRRQRGEQNQAIGRSRGGRTTKIHALTDGLCRPIAFLLTGGQVADCTAGDLLLEQMPKSPILHGDKGYDSNAIRHKVEG